MLSVLQATSTALPSRSLSRLFSALLTDPSHIAVLQHPVWTMAQHDEKSTSDVWLDTWIAMLSLLAMPDSSKNFPHTLIAIVELGLARSMSSSAASKRVSF